MVGRAVCCPQFAFVIDQVRFDRPLRFLADRIKARVDHTIPPQGRIGFVLRCYTFCSGLVGRTCALGLSLSVVIKPANVIRTATITFATAFEYRCHNLPAFPFSSVAFIAANNLDLKSQAFTNLVDTVERQPGNMIYEPRQPCLGKTGFFRDPVS